MRISDWSSDVCSSDLAEIILLDDRKFCSEKCERFLERRKPFLVDGEAAAFRVTVTFAFDDEDWRVDAGRMTAKATLGEKFAQLFLLDEIQLIMGRRENLRRYRPRGLIRLRFAASRVYT